MRLWDPQGKGAVRMGGGSGAIRKGAVRMGGGSGVIRKEPHHLGGPFLISKA
jgi:hypothetical protein